MEKWLIAFIFLYPAFFNGGKEPASASFLQALIFSAFLLYFKNLNKQKKSVSTSIDTPLLLFILFSFISSFLAPDKYSSLIGLSQILAAILFFFILLNDKKTWIIDLILITTGISCLTVIIQFLVNKPVKGFFPNPNLVSGYLVIGSGISLVRAFLRKRYVWLIPFFIFAFAVFLTHSRGGLLSLLLLLFLFSFWRWKLRGALFFSTLILSLFLIFPFGSLTKILKTERGVMNLLRPQIWKSSFSMSLDRPFFGWGPKNFIYGFYQNPIRIEEKIGRFSRDTRFAHNEFLQVLAELGFPAFLFFCWLIAKIFLDGIRMLKTDEEIRVTSFLCFGAIVTHALVDFNLHLPAILFPFLYFSSQIVKKNETSLRIPKLLTYILYPVRSPRIERGSRPRLRRGFGGQVWRLTSNGVYGIIILFLVFSSMRFVATELIKYKKFKTASFIDPLNPLPYLVLAETAKNPQSLYKTATRLNPADPYIHYGLGWLYLKRNKLKDGLAEFRCASRLHPKNPFFLADIGYVYFFKKNFQEAIKYYKRALEHEPLYIDACWKLYLCYKNLGMEKESGQALAALYLLKEKKKMLPKPDSGYETRLLDFDFSILNSVP